MRLGLGCSGPWKRHGRIDNAAVLPCTRVHTRAWRDKPFFDVTEYLISGQGQVGWVFGTKVY